MKSDGIPDGSLIEDPPHSILGILSRLGPGLIVAGSIVGSGELIATTKTGADAGFWLLWLIVIGCVIKVFVQVEFGRYSIVQHRTTMEGLAEVPGPRIPGHGNWIVWYWFLMFLASIGQLGGIVGGVGQALAISWPLTHQGREYNDFQEAKTSILVKEAELAILAEQSGAETAAASTVLRAELEALRADVVQRETRLTAELGREAFESQGRKPAVPWDDRLWAGLIAVVTSFLLVKGRYALIQNFSTAMVAGFTLVTVINVVLLQANPTWAMTWQDLVNGFSFRLPPSSEGRWPALKTALATFGIIGVGATELIMYPYWCMERGYARSTGLRDASDAWADRARGWMRVLRWDAWCSMAVYTFATIAFYILGAAILGRTRLQPEGFELVRTLTVMYEPVFGRWAQLLFLVGAFAVLYSTYFVANASHARVFGDVLPVLGMARPGPAAYWRRVKFLSGLFPLLCLLVYLVFPRPTLLVLISGLMQAIMLPMLAAAGLYFRYFRNDPRLTPSRLWDTCLIISACGMMLAGLWAIVSQFLG